MATLKYVRSHACLYNCLLDSTPWGGRGCSARSINIENKSFPVRPTLAKMKDTFSLVVLPILLELIPLVLTVVSWVLERRAQIHLSKTRRASFRSGLVLSVISLLVIASCWIDPTMAGLSLAWLVAFATSISSLVLALFGKGWPRILLTVSGALSVLLAYGSLLQNGV